MPHHAYKILFLIKFPQHFGFHRPAHAAERLGELSRVVFYRLLTHFHLAAGLFRLERAMQIPYYHLLAVLSDFVLHRIFFRNKTSYTEHWVYRWYADSITAYTCLQTTRTIITTWTPTHFLF